MAVNVNISETSGTFTGSGTAGVDVWSTTVDVSQVGNEVVTGDFDEVQITGASAGDGDGESEPYVFEDTASSLAYGTLVGNPADGTFTYTIDRAAVIASGSDQIIEFLVTGTETVNGGPRTDEDLVRIFVEICVEEGTLVKTPSGPRPVETLAVGDAVTVLDGPPQPVRWIGCTRVTVAQIEDDPLRGPVRIARDALGPGLPSADLTVSSQHRVLLKGAEIERHFGAPEVLAPAAGLVALPGVTAEPPRDVTYYHLLFDRHQVMITNGLPSESFYPGDWALREIGPAARAEMLLAVPHAASAETYGPAARPGLRMWEVKALRHRQAAA